MDERILTELGLTKTETKVYLALLDIDKGLAGEIAKNSKVHRRNVYDALNRLIEKGLAAFIIKNNRKYFYPANPKRLLEILKEKQDIAEKIMPELELRFNEKKEEEEVVFFRGKQGLKTVFDDQIEEKKEILIIGASPNADKIVKYYFPKYDKARIRNRIKIKAIFNREVKRLPLAKIRYLPKRYSTHTAINIYGDKVAIILWVKEPLAIVIKNKSIADSYKKYFEIMWENAWRRKRF